MADENTTGGAPAPAAPDPAALQKELINERFEAVAAKHGLDESYNDLVAPVAHAWLEKNGRAGTKADLAEFFTEFRASKSKLFATAPAAAPAAPAARSTAPVMPGAQPAAPAPAAIETPYTRWQALIAAGRTREAEGYYRANRWAITHP